MCSVTCSAPLYVAMQTLTIPCAVMWSHRSTSASTARALLVRVALPCTQPRAAAQTLDQGPVGTNR